MLFIDVLIASFENNSALIVPMFKVLVSVAVPVLFWYSTVWTHGTPLGVVTEAKKAEKHELLRYQHVGIAVVVPFRLIL